MLWGGYAVLITLVGICTFDYLTKILGYSLCLIFSASPFPVWMIFYVMGVMIAQGVGLPAQNRFSLVWALVGIFLCCVQIVWIHSYNGVIAQGIKLGSHIYTYFFLMWLFTPAAKRLYGKIQNFKLVNHLVVLGRLSFFIYLTHCLFIFVMNEISLSYCWIFRWLLILTLSFAFALFMNRFLPYGSKRMFGL